MSFEAFPNPEYINNNYNSRNIAQALPRAAVAIAFFLVLRPSLPRAALGRCSER